MLGPAKMQLLAYACHACTADIEQSRNESSPGSVASWLRLAAPAGPPPPAAAPLLGTGLQKNAPAAACPHPAASHLVRDTKEARQNTCLHAGQDKWRLSRNCKWSKASSRRNCGTPGGETAMWRALASQQRLPGSHALACLLGPWLEAALPGQIL